MNNTTETTVVTAAPAKRGMAFIPAGEFWMGGEDGSEAEKPAHKVWLDAYYIDAVPVTNAQFAQFIRETGYSTTSEQLKRLLDADDQVDGEGAPAKCSYSWRDFASAGREDHPVVCVSWFDAERYATWAGKRLPTEAEWEGAARGGLERKSFPWGDEQPDEHLVNWNRATALVQIPPPTTQVSSFAPNGYGCFDMVGNVWQWCDDWYDDYAYRDGHDRNPHGPAQGLYKTRRGGAWNVREAFRLRCSNRGAMYPEYFWPNLGFRCAWSQARP